MILSAIFLPGINSASESLITVEMTTWSLKARILEISLYKTVQHEINLNSLTILGLVVLGTRVMAV